MRESDSLTDKTTGRRIYIDLLKIIAIYMVVFNHTETKGFVLFTVSQASRLYPFYLFNAIFIKIAVPLFFMASGALLLGKEESYKDLLRKRFLKYLLILIFFSVVLYFYTFLRQKPQKMSIEHFMEILYSSNMAPTYWYLYTYLAYILMLPLLRKLAKAMSAREYLWMILLYGALQCLTIAEFLIWKGSITYNSSFSLFIMADHVFYPLLGYYIDRRMRENEFSIKRTLVMTAVSVLAVVVCCLMTHYRCTLIGEWEEKTCQTFFNTLIFLPAVTVFYGAKLFFMRHKLSGGYQRAVTMAGSLSFGIFLVEYICRCETEPVFAFLEPYMRSLPACWIWVLCACLLGGCITFILRLIPGIRGII